MPNDLTFTTTPSITAAPLQNVTLSVAPSSNFATSSYLYQWKAGGVDISQATQSVYKFDASVTTTYTCSVSGLSGMNNSFIYSELTPNIVVTVKADTSIFSRHTPRGANQLKETGEERYRRIRNMGYC